jgi:hypothetical protein
MSKVVITGNASGTGDFTIAAPNSNTNRTLTLPDATGTVLTTAGVPSSALPAGSVLQVVNATNATMTSNASNTFADTGLTATITPSLTSSKILVLVSQNGVYADGANNLGIGLYLLRGATNIYKMGDRTAGDKPSGPLSIGSVSGNYLDSPATTSATTYKTQFNAISSTSGAYVQVYGAVSSIILMEIAA